MKEEKILIEFEDLGMKLGYYHFEIWHYYLFRDRIMFQKLIDDVLKSESDIYKKEKKKRSVRKKESEVIQFHTNLIENDFNRRALTLLLENDFEQLKKLL